jgi:hypothetical protein
LLLLHSPVRQVEELMPQFFGRSLFALVRDQEILAQCASLS